jgi:hypothetical protein
MSGAAWHAQHGVGHREKISFAGRQEALWLERERWLAEC